VAEQLIRIGVRCVVAAGWAVEDDPAKLFARTFYQQLLRGQRFIDAVAEARAHTYARYPRSNTWAAYQCYGDPDWTYQGAKASAAKRVYAPAVASASALELQLHTLTMQHKFDGLPSDDMRERLDYLANVCKGRWDRQGAVAAAFGVAYGEAEELERAIEWYSRAIEAPDGGAGLKALEQLGNLRARHGAKSGDREEILEAVRLLERVCAFGSTAERESLLGSAYKRLARVEANATAQQDALTQSLAHYETAASIAHDLGSDDFFYPAINRMRIELRLRGASSRGAQFKAAELERVRQCLLRKSATDPNFWSAVIPIELAIYEAVSRESLAAALDAILVDLADMERRARSAREWSSVVYEIRWTLEPYLQAPGVAAVERQAVEKLLKALPKEKNASKETPAAKKRPKAKTKATRKKNRKPKKK
jgi:hypothetical protein